MSKANKQVSDQALTKPNADLGTLLSTRHRIHEEGKRAFNIKLEQFTFDDEGQKVTVIDVMKACEAADTKLESLNNQIARITGELSRYMVMLASKAGTADKLKAMFKVAEESLRWGRAPAGTQDKERKLYTGKLPKTYKEYKSKLIAHMEAGVKPLKEYTVIRRLPRPDKAGNTERAVQKVADTVHHMGAIAKDLRRRTEASTKQSGERAGIEVKQDGTQKAHMPKVDNISVDFSILVGELVELYNMSDKERQTTAINTIQNLNKNLEKHINKQATTKAA